MGPLTVGELLALIRVDDDDFRKGVDRAERRMVTAAGRMEISTERMRKALLGASVLLLKGAGLVAFASLAAVATTHTLGLVASLGSLAGLLGVVPGLALAAVGAFAALKIGLLGVADALKGDEDALAALAPQARAVVDEIRGLDGEWKRLRATVQGALFAPLRGQVADLARVWLPRLRVELGGVAAEFGLMGREAAVAARDPGFMAGVGAALLWLRQTLAANRGAVGDLVAAFGTLVGASAGVLGVSDAVARGAAAFREWATAAAQSGQLAVWFDTARTVAAQLGDVLRQVGGILAAVGQAAQEAGGGTFGVLADVLRGVNEALHSAAGQTALVALFEALQSVSGPLVDILQTLLLTVGPVLPVVLGAVAEALAALVPVAGPVGEAIAAVVRALAPLITVAGPVLADLLTVAAGMLQTFAAEFGPLIQVVAEAGAELAQAFLPALTELIAAGLPAAVELGRAFADAFGPLLPLLADLATQFMSALLPALTQLQTEMNGQLLPVLVQVAAELGGALLDALRELAPHIPDLADAAVAFARAFVELVKAGLPLVPLLTDLLTKFVGSGGMELALGMVTAAVWVMVAALSTVAASLDLTVGMLRAAWEWARMLGNGVKEGAQSALDWLGGLGGKIRDLFASAGSWLLDAGRSIIDGLVDGLKAGFGKVKDTLSGLTKMLPDWKGPADVDRRILAPSGRLIVAGLVDGVRAALPSLRDTLGAVTLNLPAMVAPPSATAAGGVDTVGLVAAVSAARPPAGTDADTIARAVRAALADMAVQLDGHAVGRMQAQTADLMLHTEF